jgi:hypothetical protein
MPWAGGYSPRQNWPMMPAVQASDGPVFVGRETELQQLQNAFDAAVTGHASLVAVPGEPGIGKTTLCEQLIGYVAEHGGRTFVGHCYEEGSLSLPYLPFVEALRSYVSERDAIGLDAELGSGAAEVARIVPELRDKLHVELRPAGDPEDDRWRLLQAVTGFLRATSATHRCYWSWRTCTTPTVARWTCCCIWRAICRARSCW